MNATLIAKMADSVVEAARLYIDQRESVLLKRISELEAREPIAGPPGKDAPPVDVDAVTAITFEKVRALIPEPIPGKDGKDGTNGKDGIDGINGKDGAAGIEGQAGKDAAFDMGAVVAEVVKAVPVPKDGKDGINGKDAPPVDTKALADEVFARVPVPENGKDGKDASPVDTDAVIKAVVAQIPIPKDGAPGKDAAEVNTKALVAEVLALVPVARDGKDGRDGKDADEKEIIKEVLEKIPPPLPGRDGMPGANGASGQNGKDGLPGRDGADGFGLDDLDVEKLDDGRTIRFKLESGERSFVKEVRFDVPLYRDTYNPARVYEKSDMVTRHNEVWIAIVDRTSEPPGGMSKQWRLAVRKGRDSKPVKITD